MQFCCRAQISELTPTRARVIRDATSPSGPASHSPRGRHSRRSLKPGNVEGHAADQTLGGRDVCLTCTASLSGVDPPRRGGAALFCDLLPRTRRWDIFLELVATVCGCRALLRFGCRSGSSGWEQATTPACKKQASHPRRVSGFHGPCPLLHWHVEAFETASFAAFRRAGVSLPTWWCVWSRSNGVSRGFSSGRFGDHVVGDARLTTPPPFT